MGETDQFHRGPKCQCHLWKEETEEPVSPSEELTDLHCCPLPGKLCGGERPGSQKSKSPDSISHQNYASLEAMSHLSATLSVTHDNCIHKLAPIAFSLPSSTQLTICFFKFSCFSMFGNPASAELHPIHQGQGRENQTCSLLQHLKFECTGAIYFRINPLKR